MIELMPLLMFLAVGLVLLSGYPVAFSLGGTALAFALIGHLTGTFDDVGFAGLNLSFGPRSEGGGFGEAPAPPPEHPGEEIAAVPPRHAIQLDLPPLDRLDLRL